MIASAEILRTGLDQARTYCAPGEMLNRLRLAAEYAEANAGTMPPWINVCQKPKESKLPVLVEEETP
jgi:hypothetical protein